MRRSKNIYGPYEEKLLMHSQGKNVDKEPNQGTIIDTPDGKWYFVTHHGTGDFDGRVMSVVPVEWVDGWPLIGKDIDNDGVGEMVWEVEKPIKNKVKEFIQTSDDFNSDKLSPQWEFNHQPKINKWSLTDNKGHLRLYAFNQLRKGDFFSTGNVISQRYIRWGKGEVLVKLDIRGMKEEQEAGLSHFNGGRDYACLAINKDGKLKLKLEIKYSSNKDVEISDEVLLPNNIKYIYLKTNIDFDGKASFSWSTNNKSFKKCTKSFQLKWGNYRGSRIGLYTFNNYKDDGFIDIDNFIYEKK
jgi:beta-xylosidase